MRNNHFQDVYQRYIWLDSLKLLLPPSTGQKSQTRACCCNTRKPEHLIHWTTYNESIWINQGPHNGLQVLYYQINSIQNIKHIGKQGRGGAIMYHLLAENINCMIIKCQSRKNVSPLTTSRLRDLYNNSPQSGGQSGCFLFSLRYLKVEERLFQLYTNHLFKHEFPWMAETEL